MIKKKYKYVTNLNPKLNISNEINIAIDISRTTKKNYQISLPKASNNRRLENETHDLSEEIIKKHYDVDAIVGVFRFEELSCIIKKPLTVNITNHVPRINNFFIENLNHCYLSTNCKYQHFAIVELPGNYRIN